MVFFLNLFLLKLLLALLVTNLLLSAGGQDGKILPAQKTNQITDSFYLARSCTQKKKNVTKPLSFPSIVFLIGKEKLGST